MAEIEAVQEAAWAETFRYVAARSPFYREHLQRAGLSLRAAIPLAEIGRIPPVDKQTVSENTEAFRCVPPDRIVDIVTTSGSTGQPLIWPLT